MNRRRAHPHDRGRITGAFKIALALWLAVGGGIPSTRWVAARPIDPVVNGDDAARAQVVRRVPSRPTTIAADQGPVLGSTAARGAPLEGVPRSKAPLVDPDWVRTSAADDGGGAPQDPPVVPAPPLPFPLNDVIGPAPGNDAMKPPPPEASLNQGGFPIPST